MSTVKQIHHLESRVDRLLATLRELRSDNESLRGGLAASEQQAAELERQLSASESAREEAARRGDELEQRLTDLHAEHEEIEATIARTLDQLGKLEIGAGGGTDGDDVADAPRAGEDDSSDADAPADEAVMQDEEGDAADDPDAGAESEADNRADNSEGDDLDIF